MFPTLANKYLAGLRQFEGSLLEYMIIKLKEFKLVDNDLVDSFENELTELLD